MAASAVPTQLLLMGLRDSDDMFLKRIHDGFSANVNRYIEIWRLDFLGHGINCRNRPRNHESEHAKGCCPPGAALLCVSLFLKGGGGRSRRVL